MAEKNNCIMTYEEFQLLPYERRCELTICKDCIHGDVCTYPDRPECGDYIPESAIVKDDSVVLTKKELDELYNDKLNSMYKDAYDTAYDSLRADLEKGKAIVLSENSVVLAPDEYNRLKRDSELYEARHEIFEKAYNQGSKETVEKIFKRLFEEHSAFNDTDVIVIWQVKEVLSNIAKEFGVEIKE